MLGLVARTAPSFVSEKVARVLADQDQAAAILSNAPSQPDKEAPDWLVFQQQAHFVDQKMARPTIATQCGPEPVGKQQTRRRHELLAQVAQVESDDVRPEVDVRRCAEEPSEIAR
jgi:hypothetical protein